MPQETLTNLWRFNVNLTATRNITQRFCASSAMNAKEQFRIAMFDKSQWLNARALLDASTVKYLREITPAIVARYLARGKQKSNFQSDDARRYSDAISFHMFSGMSTATMLYNEATFAEVNNIATMMRRGLSSHPESLFATEGMESAATLLKQEDCGTILDIVERYADTTRSFKLYSGPWNKLPSNEGDEESMAGKLTIFYNEDAVYPFVVRITNCKASGASSVPAYPYKQSEKQSLAIALTPEEFISQFLLSLYENINETK